MQNDSKFQTSQLPVWDAVAIAVLASMMSAFFAFTLWAISAHGEKLSVLFR